jgi:hypothetical protein
MACLRAVLDAGIGSSYFDDNRDGISFYHFRTFMDELLHSKLHLRKAVHDEAVASRLLPLLNLFLGGSFYF